MRGAKESASLKRQIASKLFSLYIQVHDAYCCNHFYVAFQVLNYKEIILKLKIP